MAGPGDDQGSWLGPNASEFARSVPLSELPPGAILRRPIETPAAASRELARTFSVATDQVPAMHTRIRLTEHGEDVGEIEVMHQAGHNHLVIGEQVWHQPMWMPNGTTAQRHFAAVAERLVEEAIALADRLGASLSTMTPGSVLPAERLQARGFHRAGDMWFRERPGSVVAGSFEASPGFGVPARSEVA